MTKFTRRFKKNKKNRTIKRGGDGDSSQNQKIPEESQKEDREGVIDTIQNRISNVASSASKTLADAGLRIIGLQRVDKTSEDNESIKKVDTDATSGIISGVKNVVDKTGANVIENVNEVLGSNIARETTKQAAENTAELVKEGAEKFNDALNKPEVKAELEKAIENAGEIGEVVVKAAKKPLNEAVDVASNAASKATAAALAGIIKVGTDALGAVPFFGAVIDAGKMLNDGSKAATAVVEAGSEAVEAASDAFIEAKEGVEKGLELLDKQKKMGQQISNRTIQSINDFEHPVTAQAAGAKKTRRRFLKYKAKSKRVRFAI